MRTGVPERSLPVAGLLSLSGGFLDAFTYVGHGGVFANAMTGNVIFLGLFASSGAWDRALAHLEPIVAFLAGIVAAHLLRLFASAREARSLPRICLGLEILFLAGVALLPASVPDVPIVLGIAFVAALQNSSFTHVRDWPYNSVVTTGNLRKFAESLLAGTVPRRNRLMLEQAQVFGAVCLCFLGGAVIGGLGTPHLGNAALTIPVLILAATLWLCRPVKLQTVTG